MRALIVSYSFPPVGGAGVQRVLKLVKYLPDCGITPTVLTVANPSVPVLDHSLEKDFPPGLRVIRARTFEPSYAAKQVAWEAEGGQSSSAPSLARKLRQRATRGASAIAKELLVPDPQLLWQPAAHIKLLQELLSSEKPDVVFVSGPPFSQFMMGPLVTLRSKVGLVLDYRDEWSTYRTTYEMMGSRLGNLVGEGMEARLFSLAHRVTTATEEFRANLLTHFPKTNPEKVSFIPNGYDEEDFPSQLPAPPTDKFVVTYAGTIFKLTSVRGFLDAVRLVHQRSPDLAKLLSVKFIGRIVDTELDSFAGTEALGVERLGYVQHARVIEELSASHMVLCTLDDVPGVERIYPAKIFELMYLRRPILTLSPEGALTRLVRAHHLGDIIAPRDSAAIASVLEQKLREFSVLHRVTAGTPVGIARYSRRALAKEFAGVMRDAALRARS